MTSHFSPPKKIDAIAQLMEKFIDIIRKKLPKVYSKDLVEALFTQPYCRVSQSARLLLSTLKKLKNFLLLIALKWVGMWFILTLSY